jgi:hypothetical protein
MSIENLFNRSCSFCGNNEHYIRMCNSPLIPDIDRRLSEGYYAVVQQGELLRTREEDVKERFIIWAMDLFHLKDLRVFVVTTSGSPPSGTNKRQYAEEVWNIYKAITTSATSLSTATATATTLLPEELTNSNTNLLEDDIDEITWSIDRTPRRHSDVEMAPLPSIRMSRNERVRERRARDVMNFIPSPEFVGFVRNLMHDMDMEADFIPFTNANEPNKKYNIAITTNTKDASASVNTDLCECCICMNNEINEVDVVKLNCKHQFCGDCIISTLKQHNKSSELKPSCALCRTTMTNIEVANDATLAKMQEFCIEC